MDPPHLWISLSPTSSPLIHLPLTYLLPSHLPLPPPQSHAPSSPLTHLLPSHPPSSTSFTSSPLTPLSHPPSPFLSSPISLGSLHLILTSYLLLTFYNTRSSNKFKLKSSVTPVVLETSTWNFLGRTKVPLHYTAIYCLTIMPRHSSALPQKLAALIFVCCFTLSKG